MTPRTNSGVAMIFGTQGHFSILGHQWHPPATGAWGGCRLPSPRYATHLYLIVIYQLAKIMTAFVLTTSDLHLIVPPDQASLISTELAHVEKRAQDNNLKLNVLKTKEMIVRCPRTRLGNIPPPTPGIERVDNYENEL